MEFAFTDEQQLIRDMAAGFLADHSGSSAVRAAMGSDTGHDPALWNRMCRDMVWQATHIPETAGGMGLGYVELCAILEQMGRFLFCGPFFSTVCLAANALRVAGTDTQQHRWLAEIVEGRTATLAWMSENAVRGAGDWSPQAVDAKAERHGAGWMLSGRYACVIDGATAGIVIVAARDVHGMGLYVVPATTPGVQCVASMTLDQTRRQASVILEAVEVDAAARLGPEGDASAALGMVLDLACVALAAEQVGGAQDIMDKAVAYAMERVQFGRPIASFQAIKHMAADMMLRAEVARSGVYYAACVAEEALQCLGRAPSVLAAELSEAASVAQAYVSEAYVQNAGDALQMHGGVGFTWEYDVHLHFKRAKASEHMLGTPTWHRERLANRLLDQGVASCV